jgi:hypothetical protein
MFLNILKISNMSTKKNMGVEIPCNVQCGRILCEFEL